MDYTKRKNNIFFILFALTFLLFSIIFIVQNKIEQNTIKNILKIEQTKLQNIYKYSIENFYFIYSTLGLEFIENKEVTKAVKNQNRQKLLHLSKNFYKNLKHKNPYLYNMHFHTKDAISIARIHKPEKFGDNLSTIRPMVVAVNQQKKILSGIEVGKSTISFRIAFPIFDNKQHVGSFELGIKIDYLTKLFQENFNTNSLFIFSKNSIEHIIKNTKNKNQYKSIDTIVLTQYEDCGIPNDIDYKGFNQLLQHNQKLQKNHFYLSKIATLKDYKGTPIGDVLFTVDMQNHASNLSFYKTTILLSFIVFIIILFIVLYRKLTFFVNTVKNYQEKLEKLTFYDELTKLYNRRKILQTIQTQITRLKRYKSNDTVIILDIDNFKKINDTYGHNVGDEVLKKLSNILKTNIRTTDYIGRWGGEEFLIIATQTNTQEAFILAEKLRKTIEKYPFNDVGQVTCSFGIALLDSTVDYKDSIGKADKALYSSKETGRNKVTIFSSS